MSGGISRRTFMAAAGTAGAAALIIGYKVWPRKTARATKAANPIQAWLRIDADGTATIYSAKAEMGQGVMTSLPMILAEELDIDFASVRVEQAPTNREMYSHGTGGSTSVRTQWLPLRRAGAAARQMLVSAAATRWSVAPAECRTEAGFVLHDASNRKAAYGELVADATKLPVPELETVPLKDPGKFRIVGRSVSRVDIPSKVDGSARYGLDVRLPGMLYAVVVRCPVLGGKLKSFDGGKAKAMPGVRGVFEIPPAPSAFTMGGVAVVAETTYAAMRGAGELAVEWDHGKDAGESSDGITKRMREVLASEQKAYRTEGDASGTLANTKEVIEAEYDLPFLAHAAMEPCSTVAHATAEKVEIHSPTQGGSWTQDTVSAALGIPVEKIVVHTTLLGGGFGRRLLDDVTVEAAQVSQKAGAPVMLVWTREDDMAHDFYRPASLHRLRAALDEQGRPKAWWHRMTSTPINRWMDPKGDPGGSEVGGAENLPYAIPNFRFEWGETASSVPVSWWRSVEHSITGFVTESFVDELAAAAKADPVAFRAALLEGDRQVPFALDKETLLSTRRLRATLMLAAEKAGWGSRFQEGARAAWLRTSRSTRTCPRWRRYRSNAAGSGSTGWCAPSTAAAPSIPTASPLKWRAPSRTACRRPSKNAITIADGRVQQTNFGDYDPLRIDEMPVVEVHVVPSDEPPTGIGEPGLPPVAAAVTNAVFALTGKRLRRLPIRPEDLSA